MGSKNGKFAAQNHKRTDRGRQEIGGVTVASGQPAASADPRQSTEAKLTDALRDFIRHELDELGKSDAPAAPRRSPPNLAWTILIVADFVFLTIALFEGVLEGTNLDVFLKMLPILSSVLLLVLPQARKYLENISTYRIFRIASVLLFLPFLFTAVPLFSIPTTVKPDGSVLSIAQRDRDYQEGRLQLPLRWEYSVKLTPPLELVVKEEKITYKNTEFMIGPREVMSHWFHQTKLDLRLWSYVMFHSATPNIQLRIEKTDGAFPTGFLSKLGTKLTRLAAEPNTLLLTFGDRTDEEQHWAKTFLPCGSYTFVANQHASNESPPEVAIAKSINVVEIPAIP